MESESTLVRKRMRNCPEWTELPEKVTKSILWRLGAIEILESAQKFCMKWRKVCKDPLMWRSIDMRNDGTLHHDSDCEDDGDCKRIRYDLVKMCRHAVDRTFGNLVDINIERFATDELLHYITDRSNGIRRLRLAICYKISDEGFTKVAAKLPLLEELELSICPELSHKPLEVVGRSCSLLKSFKFNNDGSDWSDDDEPDDDPFRRDDNVYALAIAGTMHGLHHLQIFGNRLNDDGLTKILDSCLHLESLDLRHCFNLNLSGDLEKRCVERIQNLRLPFDSTDGYEFADL